MDYIFSLSLLLKLLRFNTSNQEGRIQHMDIYNPDSYQYYDEESDVYITEDGDVYDANGDYVSSCYDSD